MLPTRPILVMLSTVEILHFADMRSVVETSEAEADSGDAGSTDNAAAAAAAMASSSGSDESDGYYDVLNNDPDDGSDEESDNSDESTRTEVKYFDESKQDSPESKDDSSESNYDSGASAVPVVASGEAHGLHILQRRHTVQKRFLEQLLPSRVFLQEPYSATPTQGLSYQLSKVTRNVAEVEIIMVRLAALNRNKPSTDPATARLKNAISFVYHICTVMASHFSSLSVHLHQVDNSLTVAPRLLTSKSPHDVARAQSAVLSATAVVYKALAKIKSAARSCQRAIQVLNTPSSYTKTRASVLLLIRTGMHGLRRVRVITDSLYMGARRVESRLEHIHRLMPRWTRFVLIGIKNAAAVARPVSQAFDVSAHIEYRATVAQTPTAQEKVVHRGLTVALDHVKVAKNKAETTLKQLVTVTATFEKRFSACPTRNSVITADKLLRSSLSSAVQRLKTVATSLSQSKTRLSRVMKSVRRSISGTRLAMTTLCLRHVDMLRKNLLECAGLVVVMSKALSQEVAIMERMRRSKASFASAAKVPQAVQEAGCRRQAVLDGRLSRAESHSTRRLRASLPAIFSRLRLTDVVTRWTRRPSPVRSLLDALMYSESNEEKITSRIF